MRLYSCRDPAEYLDRGAEIPLKLRGRAADSLLNGCMDSGAASGSVCDPRSAGSGSETGRPGCEADGARSREALGRKGSTGRHTSGASGNYAFEKLGPARHYSGRGFGHGFGHSSGGSDCPSATRGGGEGSGRVTDARHNPRSCVARSFYSTVRRQNESGT